MLGDEMTKVVSALSTALSGLGRYESRINYVTKAVERELQAKTGSIFTEEYETFKVLIRGTSDVMKAEAHRIAEARWHDFNEVEQSLWRTMAIRDRLKRKVDALVAYKEHLSRTLELRKLETSKGMRY